MTTQPQDRGSPPARCAKCQGALARDQDRYGAYLYCRNCGSLTDLAPPPASPILLNKRTQAPDPADLLPSTLISNCAIAPSCLDCPLPQCKYDKRADKLTLERWRRDQEIALEIQREGLTHLDAAERFGVAPRTIARIVVRYRKRLVSQNNPETSHPNNQRSLPDPGDTHRNPGN